MKTIHFTNRENGYYACTEPGDNSGEYVRADVARELQVIALEVLQHLENPPAGHEQCGCCVQMRHKLWDALGRPNLLDALREEWGIQWAIGTPERGYFARVAYRDLNGENFYMPLGEKISITAEDFAKIDLTQRWQPAEAMPDWAVRKRRQSLGTIATAKEGVE
jgi:hypothetical protein